MSYEIQIEIEKSCFLDCLHCSSLETRKHKSLNYEIKDLTNLLNLFKDKKEIILNMTGGEPLVSQRLKPILESVKNNKNIKPGIFTCGIINKNLSEIVIDSKSNYLNYLKSCYISIYSLDENEHDKITNLKGALSTTLKSIKNLKEIGVDIKIHLVLNKFNINKIEEIILGLFKIGVSEVRILKLVKNGSANINWDLIGVEDSLQDKVIKKIFLKKDIFKNKITFSGFPEMVGCRPFEGSKGCQAGCNLLYVTIDGDVFPCACTKGMKIFYISKITELDKIKDYINLHKNTIYHEKCLKYK